MLLSHGTAERLIHLGSASYGPTLTQEEAAGLTYEVAAGCGEITCNAVDTVLERPGLLPWLTDHADAIYLSPPSGDLAGPKDEATMQRALKDKAWRNTLLGYGRTILWLASVDRYAQGKLPNETDPEKLEELLWRSHPQLNGIASLDDRVEELTLEDAILPQGIKMDLFGNIPHIMMGRMYIDPSRLYHAGAPGRERVLLRRNAPAAQDTGDRQGCPMLQRPYRVGARYIGILSSIAAKHYIQTKMQTVG